MVFHLPPSMLAGAVAPFYQSLIDGILARGGVARVVPHLRESVAGEVAADAGFHILDHGAVRHPRVLNTGVAYLYPFRNMDPWGIRATSSIWAKVFDPASIPVAEARAFADRLRHRLVRARQSRYEQAEVVVKIPQNCIAVFLQAEAHRGVGETCHLTLREMVKALIARDDRRPIVIKPHPRDFSEATHRFLRQLARKDARVMVTPANIHDILSVASVVVTINSAVGIEAMLHGRPVVLCGKADFHHAAVTVFSPAGLSAGIAEAEARLWPHDGFLTWYFSRQCLQAGKPGLVDDFLVKIAETGFDPAQLGLRAGADLTGGFS